MPVVLDPNKAQVLLLIDGFNLAFRSWLVTNFTKGFKNAEDYPTCHIYNSLMKYRMWLNAVGLKAGKRVCPVFSFYENRSIRQKLYPQYKGTRESEDYRAFDVTDWDNQMTTLTVDPTGEVESMFRLFPSLHLTPVNNDGETDDILSTFVNVHRRRPGVEIWLMTNDHDAWFDVRGNVHVGGDIKNMTTIDMIRRTPNEHGFSTRNPRKVPLAKALFGDQSDNIEKVPNATELTIGPLLRKCQMNPETDKHLYAYGFLAEVKKALRENPKHPAKCIRGYAEHIIRMEQIIRPRNTLELYQEHVHGDISKLRKRLEWYGIKRDLQSYLALSANTVF